MDTNQEGNIPETNKSWSFKESFSKLWKEKGDLLPSFSDITPRLSRFSLSSGWIWIFAIFINALVLVKYLSPLVLSNSLFPIILPTGIAAGLFGGINDFFGLFGAIKAVAADFSSGAKDLITIFGAFASKLGYALSAVAIFILMLTAQSIYRVAHFIDQLFYRKNLKDSVKEALAITNPLLTFAVFNIIMLPWLMGHKMIIAAIVSLWVGPDIITVFSSSNEVATIVNTLAKAASAAVICIIIIHLIIVAFAYILIYKMQCKLVDVIFEKDFKSFFKKAWSVFVNIWDAVWGWLVAGVLGSIVVTLIVSCAQNMGKPVEQDKYGFYRRSGSHDYCSVVTKNNEVFAFAHSKGVLHVLLNPKNVSVTGDSVPWMTGADRSFNMGRTVSYVGADCREVVNVLSDKNFMKFVHDLARIEYSPIEYKMRGGFIDINIK